MDAKKIILEHFLSPGDVLVMTAAVECLKKQFPHYQISVHTTCSEIWNHNPNVVPSNEGERIRMHYPNIHQSHLVATSHFMRAFTDYLGEQLNIPLKLNVNKPFIYLSEEEKNKKIIDGKYIVVNAGTKQDYTCKGWGFENYQAITNELFKRGYKVVQIGEAHHLHKQLNKAINMMGKTGVRDLFSLCYNSVAGIGPVTFLQHIYAAFEKPYVCLAGGREPMNWIWYPGQAILSTQGQLKCCRPNACWKSRVVPLNDGSTNDKSLCVLSTDCGKDRIPMCMAMIRPQDVLREIEKYEMNGLI